MRMRKPDPRYFKPAFYLFVTAAALLLFQQGLSSLGNLWGALGQAAAGLWQGMLPLSCGAILAYILRPLASGLEKGCLRIFPGLEKKARALSLVLLYFISIFLSGIFYKPKEDDDDEEDDEDEDEE